MTIYQEIRLSLIIAVYTVLVLRLVAIALELIGVL